MPERRSSITTRSPAEPKAPANISSMAAWASSMWSGTITPLPAARPSALSTGRSSGPRISSHLCAAWAVSKSSPPACGTPADCMTCLANHLEDSIRAASRAGPKARMPRSVRASTSPAARGASGPTTTRSMRRCSAASQMPSMSESWRLRFSPSSAVPALPGAARMASQDGDWASFQASACSRPPPPTIRMRMLRGYPTAASSSAGIRLRSPSSTTGSMASISER